MLFIPRFDVFRWHKKKCFPFVRYGINLGGREKMMKFNLVWKYTKKNDLKTLCAHFECEQLSFVFSKYFLKKTLITNILGFLNQKQI